MLMNDHVKQVMFYNIIKDKRIFYVATRRLLIIICTIKRNLVLKVSELINKDCNYSDVLPLKK